jgi:signal transduction histidine kinase
MVLEEEMTRLEHLIQTFLDYARPPLLERRSFEAREVVQQVVSLVSARAGQRGVNIECALPEQPVELLADVGQFRQVLLNLLLNALDATEEGGTVWLEVATEARLERAAARPGKWFILRVADTGHGLPPALGQRIFEPFVSTKETGLGLGLSICKRLVEAHGGEITAADRPGGGAIFTVRLPWSTTAEPPGRSPDGGTAFAPRRVASEL